MTSLTRSVTAAASGATQSATAATAPAASTPLAMANYLSLNFSFCWQYTGADTQAKYLLIHERKEEGDRYV